MKQALLGSSALAAAFSIAFPASAAEPIKLTIGGFFREAYLVVADDNEAGEPGFNSNTDGFFNDAEIHFTGATVLDNGLEIGARVELEGETEEDQVDEAWVWFSGGFGEFRFGSDDDALSNACVVPPGGTANFSAFSPNQWGANSDSSNPVCGGLDDPGDAQKVLYITPVFHGFQLTASYTPDPHRETHDDGVGPHLGMTSNLRDHVYDASFYLTYAYEGEDWGLTWGGGVSFSGDFHALVDPSQSLDIDQEKRQVYQTGLTLSFGNLALGGVFSYFNNLSEGTADFFGTLIVIDQDVWVAGGGIAYTHDAWTFGAQYSYRSEEFFQINGIVSVDFEQVQQRAVATVNYALGPGISIDGELGYTWVDTDPGSEGNIGGGSRDDYDGVEIGIGTVITF